MPPKTFTRTNTSLQVWRLYWPTTICCFQIIWFFLVFCHFISGNGIVKPQDIGQQHRQWTCKKLLLLKKICNKLSFLTQIVNVVLILRLHVVIQTILFHRWGFRSSTESSRSLLMSLSLFQLPQQLFRYWLIIVETPEGENFYVLKNNFEKKIDLRFFSYSVHGGCIFHLPATRTE